MQGMEYEPRDAERAGTEPSGAFRAEVDREGIEPGQKITVKWRDGPCSSSILGAHVHAHDAVGRTFGNVRRNFDNKEDFHF